MKAAIDEVDARLRDEVALVARDGEAERKRSNNPLQAISIHKLIEQCARGLGRAARQGQLDVAPKGRGHEPFCERSCYGCI